jgi:hypothetical protein
MEAMAAKSYLIEGYRLVLPKSVTMFLTKLMCRVSKRTRAIADAESFRDRFG